MNRLTFRTIRGFSLIEVLIAILILALGLLGLGAVIPVVVKQQRSATDATLGVAAAKAAQAYLLSRPQFDPAGKDPANAWGILLSNTSWGGGPNNPTFLWNTWAMTTSASTPDFRQDTGDMTFRSTTLGPASTVTLQLADRLWPSDSTQPLETVGSGLDPYRPMFVWDIICRRVKVNEKGAIVPGPAQIQVAIFVRRIDANIPLPRVGTGTAGESATFKLVDVLTGRHSAPRRLPVAVESLSNPLPTNNGSNSTGGLVYGAVQKVGATFDPATRDRITLSSSSPQILLDLAARPDQKLVDNLGNVYTVREIIEDPDAPTDTIVRITPPVPTSVGDPAQLSGSPENETRFQEVIFTPQIPGAVRVFTVVRPK